MSEFDKQLGEIIIYQTDDGLSKIEVSLQNETVWLSIDQMAELFQRDRSVIGKHIRNIFKEGELKKESVWAKFAYTAADGKDYNVDFYNLDVIISVGYRVKSIRGTQFRIWANSVLKEYIIKGFAIEHKPMYMIDYVEQLDSVLSSGNRKILAGSGSVSHDQAMKKAKDEYRKYQEITLSPVEEEYLKSIRGVEKEVKKHSRKKSRE